MKRSPSSDTIVCTGRLPAEHFCKICLSFQLSPAARTQLHGLTVQRLVERQRLPAGMARYLSCDCQMSNSTVLSPLGEIMVFIGGLVLSQE